MQRIFGICSDQDYASRCCLNDPWNSNYASIMGSFYNLDDQSRSFIGTNFSQLDEIVTDYLTYRGIIQRSTNVKEAVMSDRSIVSGGGSPDRKVSVRGSNYSSEMLLATVEILSFKIEAAHMQRVLISWISEQGSIPSTTQAYTKIMRKY